MILEIENLKTYYQIEKGVVKANDGISLVHQGERGRRSGR